MTSNTFTRGRAGLGLPTPSALLRALHARAVDRRSRAALRRLDDRLLRDVGLTRADVAALTADL